MNSFKSLSIVFLSFLIATSACGNKSEEAIDTETTSQAAFSSVEDATEAITDDASSTMTAQALAQIEPASTSVTITRACSKSGDVVTVARTFSGSGSVSITRPRMSMTIDMSGTGTDTRQWTPPSGQTISCSSSTGTVRFNWLDDAIINGMQLGITIDRSRSSTKTLTVAGKTKTVTDNATIQGTRAVTWATNTASSSSILSRTKTISWSVTRSKTFTKNSGDQSTFQATVATKSDAPIVVTVERLKSDGSLQKKTISSGTIISTMADGMRVEASFSNLIFDYTGENICLPASGQIDGSIYAKDATTASKTFVIQFGSTISASVTSSSGVTISYDGGTAEDYSEYNAKGCDLERES
ncbi:MAG: hypothetical protein AABZ06_11875 [Bdellovibrionota bacterium]